MPDIAITAIYAAAIVLLMAALSTIVGALRGKHSVALGDGALPDMALAIRRFGNLSEYAAAALLILLLMELRGINPFWLHAYGLAFLVLRVLHPIVLFDDMAAPMWKKAGRFLTGAGTAGLMSAGAIALLWTS